jgi:hypothetical protein
VKSLPNAPKVRARMFIPNSNSRLTQCRYSKEPTLLVGIKASTGMNSESGFGDR